MIATVFSKECISFRFDKKISEEYYISSKRRAFLLLLRDMQSVMIEDTQKCYNHSHLYTDFPNYSDNIDFCREKWSLSFFPKKIVIFIDTKLSKKRIVYRTDMPHFLICIKKQKEIWVIITFFLILHCIKKRFTFTEKMITTMFTFFKISENRRKRTIITVYISKTRILPDYHLFKETRVFSVYSSIFSYVEEDVIFFRFRGYDLYLFKKKWLRCHSM